MTQFKILPRIFIRTTSGQHRQLSITSKLFCSTKAPDSVHPSTAKPLSACPKITAFEMVRGFLPGGNFYKKDLREMTRELHREKGDIFYMPGMFGSPNIIMTKNPNDFETLFRNDGVWPIREGNDVLTYHRNVHQKDFFGEASGLIPTQGKQWGDFRSIVNPVLMHPKNVKKYLPNMLSVTEDFIQRIKTIRDPKTLEVPADFKDEINRWTLESVAIVALDTKLDLISGRNPDGKRIFSNMQEFFQLVVELEVKPSLWRHLPNRKFRRAMTVLDDMLMITEKYVNEAVQRLQNSTATKDDGDKSVLEKLYAIDKKIATIMAMDMMFGGVDTTTTAFTGLLLCLAKNPAKQQKLREEILQFLPNKSSVITEENMRNMPYLRACLKESLRVYPFASANLRTTSKDLVFSGYRIPKGTYVATIYLELLTDSQHYSQPEEFIPERWLRQPKDTKSESTEVCPHSTATKSSHPFVYLPFGFGPRSCIGRRIAEMEIEIGIVNILRNFELEFNHSTENAFMALQINVPAIPLTFKFIDIVD